MGTARRRTRRPRLQGASLRLGRQELPLLSGAVHYWRLQPEHWPAALDALAAMGLPLLETYVPWGVHERAPGEFDFGEGERRLDVGAFLDLAAERGLHAIVRPGPCINAELTHFGLPERVVFDPACQARSPRQRPVLQPFPPRMFPVPSYASRAYHREVGRWYDAVAEVLRPRLWPDGPIVLLQVDNEAAFFFRDGPYEQDYHPDALSWWAEFLADRYGSLEALAEAYGEPAGSWDEVPPPTAPPPDGDRGALRRALDWAAFREELLARAVGRMRRRMQRAGLSGVPTLHNVPLGDGGLPVSLPRMAEEADVVGLDYYHPAREHRAIKRRTLRLVGTAGPEAAYAPEMGAGAPPWFVPLDQHDSLYAACCALAFGLRGFNLYMAVDRDRWYGAPVASDGTARPEAADWKRLLEALRRVGFHRLRRRAEVALLWPREYARLSRATHLLGLLSPSALEALGGTPVDGCGEEEHGLGEPVQLRWWRWLAAVSDALTAAQVPYVYVDADAPEERLAGYRLIFSPTFAFADPERLRRLRALAEAGATVVTGPREPELDERLRPATLPAVEGPRLPLPDEADAEAPQEAVAERVRRLCEEVGIAPPARIEPEPLEVTVHEDERGRARLLFVLNPQERAAEATLWVPEGLRLRDALDGTELPRAPGEPLALTVPGRAARLLEVEETATGGTR